MKTSGWMMFGFASLLITHPLIAQAAKINHAALSDRIIKQAASKFGQAAANRLVAWSNLVFENKNTPIAEKLALVNRFINSIPLKSEHELWGHEHWSTPYEMIARNAGSHADHAIGKYVTLEGMGVEVDKMQITHVHSVLTPSQSYMVLTYYPKPDAMPLVLDSVNPEIKPANERKDLIPEHSMNDDGVWIPRVQADGANDAREEAAVHIDLLQELNERMDKELLSAENPSAIQ